MDKLKPDDGFANLRDTLDQSLPFERLELHGQLAPGQPTKTMARVQQMEYDWRIRERLQQQLATIGRTVTQHTINTASQIPGLVVKGLQALYSRFTTTTQVAPIVQPQDQMPAYDPTTETIILVMPEEIKCQGIAAQNKWIEEHKDEYQIFVPKQKIKLGNSTSSNSSFAPDTDVLRISDQFRNIQNLDDMTQQFWCVSEPEYLKIVDQIEHQQVEVDTTEQKQVGQTNLYPFLPTIIRRSQFLKEHEQLQLEKTEQAFINLEQSTSFFPLEQPLNVNPLYESTSLRQFIQQTEQQQSQQQQQQQQQLIEQQHQQEQEVLYEEY